MFARRVLFCFLVFCCVFIVPGSAQVVTLPSCAKTCLTTAYANSGCDPLAELSCLCDNKAQLSKINDCASTSCTVRDTFTTINATSTACGAPIRDRSGSYGRVNLAFFLLSVLAIGGRFATNLTSRGLQPLDDTNMAVILLINIVLFAVTFKMSFTGLGQDMWKVPFDQITTTLLYFWISEVAYFAVIGLVRISFLLFYLKIFPKRNLRNAIWGFTSLIFLSMITFSLAAVFVCSPVNYAWLKWDGLHKGKCVNNNALAFSHAAWGILTDFVTLALPITQIWNLHLATKKKIGVLLMFSVGSFVTVVSIVRLRALVHFAKTSNITWDYLEASLWSVIEVYVGIVCACMPSLRLGLQRLFPKFLGSSLDAASKPTGTGGTQGNTLNPGSIAVQTSFRISHSRKPQTNEHGSFVQLVEIDGDAKSMDTGGRREGDD
ncbi:hypothetical protein BCR34DRAFT_91515 [Clohesyomyces aquaticus]|uniref:CFEM domain-containing protein n=1 Tax=Clohesyomyces aquaticus TaxID=1231657 RepID=A0A1Y1YUH1_9PLEO|nr:hypothetical protein BCR34DRAFT_91515 [Clohesyomyces aquaticus]